MNEQKKLTFRHEFKYLTSVAELQVIKYRLHHLLCVDEHVGRNQTSYRVRSLYFDDPANRCYYENENGTDPREKFRIRIYNHSLDRITLECKRKERGKTYKSTCPLTYEQARILAGGHILPVIGEQPPLLQKLTMKMMTEGLRPVVIVEYDRMPYTCRNGNVRITLDTGISASRSVESFFDDRIPRRLVMPAGQQILEVKFDAYLPDFIKQNLQLHSLRQTTFSKYYIGRKFSW